VQKQSAFLTIIKNYIEKMQLTSMKNLFAAISA
jgi:hypothetical protein